ncbi:hypothetical protein C8J57DRAFT_1509211 [Mycena rebaudengoi]|nr:hypothetical protein C8J57DRAFT_1509211 [Mycena rebaudengoi]
MMPTERSHSLSHSSATTPESDDSFTRGRAASARGTGSPRLEPAKVNDALAPLLHHHVPPLIHNPSRSLWTTLPATHAPRKLEFPRGFCGPPSQRPTAAATPALPLPTSATPHRPTTATSPRVSGSSTSSRLSASGPHIATHGGDSTSKHGRDTASRAARDYSDSQSRGNGTACALPPAPCAAAAPAPPPPLLTPATPHRPTAATVPRVVSPATGMLVLAHRHIAQLVCGSDNTPSTFATLRPAQRVTITTLAQYRARLPLGPSSVQEGESLLRCVECLEEERGRMSSAIFECSWSPSGSACGSTCSAPRM